MMDGKRQSLITQLTNLRDEVTLVRGDLHHEFVVENTESQRRAVSPDSDVIDLAGEDDDVDESTPPVPQPGSDANALAIRAFDTVHDQLAHALRVAEQPTTAN